MVMMFDRVMPNVFLLYVLCVRSLRVLMLASSIAACASRIATTLYISIYVLFFCDMQ
jgi:hypothetical protein